MASLVSLTNDGEPFAVFTKEIDEVWAKGVGITQKTVQSYFDYYYSGQDVQIFIEGIGDPLPLAQFAYSVEQKKTPVYGHASYAYDAVMRGNRLVTGAFSVVTTRTAYMTHLLSQAADEREHRRTSGNPLSSLSLDAENIQQYWHNVNADSTVGPSGRKQIFSAHPPFNFILTIGMQPDSNAILGEMNCDEVGAMYSLDAVMHNDFNERLMDSDPEGSNKRMIKNVELVKFDTQVSVDGDILLETYSFFARDEYPLMN